MSEPRDEIAEVLAAHLLTHHFQTIEGFTPCVCPCGWTRHCGVFGNWATCEREHRDHIATVLAERDRRVAERAWDEGANAAVEPVNAGTRMTLRAVLPFPSNPYREATP